MPIHCDFHDDILPRTICRSPCEIVYHNEAGETTSVRAIIEDADARQGEEFMRL